METGLKRKLIAGITIVTLVGIATIGQVGESKAEADGTWVNDQLAENNAAISGAGYEKKEEIKQNANGDIKDTINGKLEPKVKTAEEELQEMLDEYYRLKLEGLESSDEYKYLEEQISITKKSIYDRYVKEVDAIFAGQ